MYNFMPQQQNQFDYGSRLAERVTLEEADLASQRGDYQQAQGAFTRLLILGLGRIFNR